MSFITLESSNNSPSLPPLQKQKTNGDTYYLSAHSENTFINMYAAKFHFSVFVFFVYTIIYLQWIFFFFNTSKATLYKLNVTFLTIESARTISFQQTICWNVIKYRSGQYWAMIVSELLLHLLLECYFDWPTIYPWTSESSRPPSRPSV